MSIVLEAMISSFRSLGLSVRRKDQELEVQVNNPSTQIAQLRAVQDKLVQAKRSYRVEFSETKLLVIIPLQKEHPVPTVLTLVRHGESEQNKILHSTKNPELLKFKIANPGLTETGLAQARCNRLSSGQR